MTSTTKRLDSPWLPSALRGRMAVGTAVVLACWLAGAASYLTAVGAGLDKLVWLPSGVGVAALLWFGLRFWPAVAGGALALGVFQGLGAAATLLLGMAAVAEALVCALLLRRMRFETGCERMRDVLALVVAAVAAGLAGGAVEFFAIGGHGWGEVGGGIWWSCLLGRVLGIVLLVPLLPPRQAVSHVPLSAGRLAELALLTLSTGGLSLAVFASMGDPTMFNPLPYALFPLLFWGALRFGPREVAGLLLIAGFLAAWGTAGGHGPFAAGGLDEALGSLYLYLGVVAVVALALAASVAERSRVARTLAESEAKYRELVETMSEGVVALDADGRVRFASEPLARMLGRTPAELSGWSVSALFGEGAHDWAAHLDPADPARRLPAVFETELARPDGSRVQVSVSARAMRNALSHIVGWLAVVSDISERKRTEETLAWIARATAPLTGEAFFRELMRHMAGAFRFRTAMITECVDYPVTRVRVLACWDADRFAAEDEFALAGTPCEQAVCEARPYCVPERVAVRYACARGQGVEGYLGVPVMDSANARVIGHVAFFSAARMDEGILGSALFRILLSRAGAELRRKRAEEQGRQHMQQLAQVSRALALGEMGSAIAHELNQPLAAIATYSQACRRLLEAGEGGDEVRRALDRMGVQAERAGEILRRLRGFLARTDTVSARSDIDVLVAEVIDLARPEARSRTVELVLRPAGDLPPVNVDGIQFQQVVLNLVRNAIEAVAEAGGALRQVVVATRRAEGGVEVAVSDSGPGIAPDLAERIFEPFFTTKASGTGIGLAIGNSIAEAHGGRLRLETVAGGGACFVFWLPRPRSRDDD
ncbi:MAG: ATP-binding protein [Rhodocyclaceae bacterium]